MFRTALSRFASGVTVVTSARDGELVGMTVSAFSSISLDPHLVMVSLAEDKPTTRVVTGTGWFVVNVLRDDQRELSEGFAWRADLERFDGVDWSYGPHDLPILTGTLATLVCRVHHTTAGGDHVIIIGEAIAGRIDDGEPLVYSQGRYRVLAEDVE